MRVGIVGSGKMGEWFARYFKNIGIDVTVYDIDNSKSKRVANTLRINHAKTLNEVTKADVVFICVSISKTQEVVKKAGTMLGKNQTLVEIASLKSSMIEDLKKLDCNVLSIHPMFGPQAKSIDGQNIIVISDVSNQRAKDTVIPLLFGAKIAEYDTLEHEKMMALVLSLPYAINIAFHQMVEENKIPIEVAGPTFLAQLEIAKKVVKEEEDLKEELMKNSYSAKIIQNYMEKIKKLTPSVEAISVSEMRTLEEKEFAKGATVLDLMERAGKRCAQLIETKQGTGNRTVIFCGPGNNGGDGLVCARYLAKNNDVVVVVPIEPKTDEARTNYKRMEEKGIHIISMEEAKGMQADIVIDALLGIGAKGALRGRIREACKVINSLEGFKISVDVPTGMDAESGKCDVDAVKPDATICIHAPKIGEKKAGKEQSGELWVADICL